MKITTIGIDLAKNTFQVHGVNAHGTVTVRKAIRRDQMGKFFANLEPCLVGMEACGSAHYWARKLQGYGQADGTAIRQTLRQEQQERCR